MKFNSKKLLCIVMSLALCLPLIGMYAYADDGKIEYHDSGRLYTINRFPEDEVYFPKKVIRPKVFLSNNNAGSYHFYDYLGSAEKAIYNSLKNTKAGLESDTQGLVKVKFNSSRNLPSASSAELENKIVYCVVAAISALLDDYPEYFWIFNFGFNYGSSVSESTYYLSELTVYLALNEAAYPNWNTVNTYYQNLLNSVASFEVHGNSRYAKVKSIHDSIAAQVTYDPDYDNSKANPIAHEPTGVFTEPYYAVCEGYAEACKLLCDRENIPCICVVGWGAGGAHKWNYVQMEDGKWYGLDITWDDQDDHLMYDYFLVGKNSKNGFFGGTDSFGTDHIPTGALYNIDFSLTYPEISTLSYTAGLLNDHSTATFSNPKGMMYIPKNTVLSEEFLATSLNSEHTPDDHTVSVSGVTTGAEVSVMNVASDPRSYKVVRWGDVDKSNSVDFTDFTLVTSAAQLKSNPDDECSFAAGDLNEDGVIDGFDAIYLELYLADEVQK